jgi:hypothetical protein
MTINRADPALLRAYRSARYGVEGAEVRIGKPSAVMDRLLREHGVREATFITAYNPFSRIMPPGWNTRMQARLRLAMRRRPVLFGRGYWRRWSEAHLIVFGDARPVRQLARRFRQHGIVVIRPRQPARLTMVFESGFAVMPEATITPSGAGRRTGLGG